MRTIFSAMIALLAVSALRGSAQNGSADLATANSSEPAVRMLFPHNCARGFISFGGVPSHNEMDLNRCAFPQPASAGGANSLCTAYARYFFSGYLELHPFGRTLARRFFFFFEPKFSFGNNIPQLKYTGSMEPIAFDHLIGVGISLPKNFELRVTR